MNQDLEVEDITAETLLEITPDVELKIAMLCDECQFLLIVEACRAFFASLIWALVRRSDGQEMRGIDLQVLDLVNFDENCQSCVALRLDPAVIFIRFVGSRRRFQIYDVEILGEDES